MNEQFPQTPQLEPTGRGNPTEAWFTTTHWSMVLAAGGQKPVPVGDPRAGDYYRLALSPDGRRLAAGGSDGRITIWDVASHQEVATIEGHKEAVWQLAFTPGGDHLVSVSMDQLRVWRAASPAEADAVTVKEAGK